MNQYIDVTVTSGKHGAIRFEIDSFEPAQDSKELVTKFNLEEDIQKVIEKTTVTFDQFKDTILALSGEFKEVMQKAMPDEASLEFGLTVKADAGVLVAKVGAEAAIKVNLTWKRKDNNDASNG